MGAADMAETAETAAGLIRRFEMQRHPEGGWFKETYRSEMMVETARGPRPASTAIFFLLEAGQVSHFHRIASDELWHFYAGNALEVLEFDDANQLIITRIDQGQPLHCVKAGRWFGSRPIGDYAFVGCTVSPGFDFADFELAKHADLPSGLYDLSSMVLAPND